MIIEKMKATELRKGDRINIKSKGVTKIHTITEVVEDGNRVNIWSGLRCIPVRADSMIRVLRQGITTP